MLQVRLSSLVSISLEERRGSLTLVLGLREGRLVMRRTEGIREWQRGLQRLSGGGGEGCAGGGGGAGCGGGVILAVIKL